MPTAIGINGFGRIGRLVMRAALDHPDGEWIGCWIRVSCFVFGLWSDPKPLTSTEKSPTTAVLIVERSQMKGGWS